MYNDEYLSHSGRKGQRWGFRYHQSYAVAPRGSGKGGQELGEAAEQRNRVLRGDDDEPMSDRERKRRIKAAKKQMKREKKDAAREASEEKKLIKTREEAEKVKKKALESGDPDQILRFNKYHPDMISNEELERAIQRINKEDTLRDLAKKHGPQIKTGEQKMKELSAKLDTAAKIAGSAAKIAEAGNKIYKISTGQPIGDENKKKKE